MDFRPGMNTSVPDILARIIQYKRAELESPLVSRGELEELARDARCKHRDFRAALLRPGASVIAEFKRASPSKGDIARDCDPADVAQSYQRGGAAALSVLTDENFFGGSLEDLAAARGNTDLPVLRKDFTLDEYHIAEAAAHCADAVLLIASILDTKRLRELREYADRLSLAALVEVHDEPELKSAIDSGATIIGVNNRNLRTFEVTLETAMGLAGMIPASVVKVSESGIRTSADVHRLQQAGYDAFLVGEHLMRSHDRAAAVRELTR
ncbi:MAG TPA: indole-3-glycerol phosphate synthase TrpC [Bryobacteraceae bacterium]|nr:indole-3-glycerol phosphate synthase TrpC [Bryobacteraceae bacterium]